jgi:hypothetical protein
MKCLDWLLMMSCRMTQFLLLLICAGFADGGGGAEAAAEGWRRRLALEAAL